MAEDEKTRLHTHHRLMVGHGRTRVGLSVFCPRELRSLHVDLCRRCPRMLVADEDAVYCVPEVDVGRASLLVGSAMGARSVAVDADTRVDELSQIRDSGTWMSVVVLDGDHHPMGMIDAGAIGAVDGTLPAHVIARPITPVRETSPVTMAVQRMVRERARVLPVVDEGAFSVGVLTDLDALRWAAARAKGAAHGGGT